MQPNRNAFASTREAVLEALAGIENSPEVDNFTDMMNMMLVCLEKVASTGRDIQLEAALTGAARTIVQRRSCKLYARAAQARGHTLQ